MGVLSSSMSGLSTRSPLAQKIGQLGSTAMGPGGTGGAATGVPGYRPTLVPLGAQANALKQQAPPAQPMPPQTGSPVPGPGGTPLVPGAQALVPPQPPLTPQAALGGAAPTPAGRQFPRRLLGPQGTPAPTPAFPAPMA